MQATIRDVAFHAGVSPSTVSRVLNGSCPISAETKERVYTVVRELGYHPNSLAQSFVKGRAGAVALVLDASATEAFSNAFFNRSVFAVETVMQQHGYNLIISNDRRAERHRSPIEEMVLSRRADGLLIPPAAAAAKLLDTLDDASVPFVVLGQPGLRRSCSWVDVDNAQGARQAVEHLIGQGYRRIAFLSDNHKALFTQNRLRGYAQVLELVELAHEEAMVPIFGSEAECRGAVSALMASPHPPDAFVCGNNALAFHALQAVKERGLSVPGDVGIVTFDNFPLAEYTEPPLTSVDVDTYMLGQRAASLLIEKIEGRQKAEETLMLSTQIIVRQSSKRREDNP